MRNMVLGDIRLIYFGLFCLFLLLMALGCMFLTLDNQLWI